MDTTTVLAIIEMIDARLKNLCTQYELNEIRDEEFCSASDSLSELSEHLQSFIEGQVNALENQTEQ